MVGEKSGTSTAKLLGVISDTHGLLRPEAAHELAGVDLIVHAGDIGTPDVLEELSSIAPVVAVRGNVDRGPWAGDIPERRVVEVGEHRLYVLHDVNELDLDPTVEKLTAVVAGHSHRPLVEERDGVLFLNPGSAGPRRFTLPVALARVRVRASRLEPRLVELTV